MLSLHSPITQDFTRLQKTQLVAQELYPRCDTHLFGSCSAFLGAQGGLVLWFQAAVDASPSPVGEHMAIGVWLGRVPTRALAFCPDFKAIKILHLKLFCLQTLKSPLQMKQVSWAAWVRQMKMIRAGLFGVLWMFF